MKKVFLFALIVSVLGISGCFWRRGGDWRDGGDRGHWDEHRDGEHFDDRR
jgi:hypothetical protein